jgi:hypothetical protein
MYYPARILDLSRTEIAIQSAAARRAKGLFSSSRRWNAATREEAAPRATALWSIALRNRIDWL